MSVQKTAVVVTSINRPNEILSAIASGSAAAQWELYLVGDRKSPEDFSLPECRYFDVAAQLASNLKFAEHCPFNHYARKNVGYLLAIQAGASIIVETDDDNIPEAGFWSERVRLPTVRTLQDAGWINAYAYFSDRLVWPRGLPLDAIHSPLPPYDSLVVGQPDCPIQQGLADDNPDVDAVYRLIFKGALKFRTDRRIAFGTGTWCPFNSQNTTWWREAFPLLYLPAYCSFRMTDIWRSFVATRIAWENGWSLLFHEPTVRQERNEHVLMRDFADEVPGYLNNRTIEKLLSGLTLVSGREAIPENMRRCYRALAEAGIVGAQEPPLLDIWLSDLARVEAERP